MRVEVCVSPVCVCFSCLCCLRVEFGLLLEDTVDSRRGALNICSCWLLVNCGTVAGHSAVVAEVYGSVRTEGRLSDLISGV